MLEPNQVGVTFHRIIAAPDAGDILHQVRPVLDGADGLHDVAQKALQVGVEAMVQLIAMRNSGIQWEFKQQRSSGKNWLHSDFKPEHLRVVYNIYNDDMVKHYLNGTLKCKEPYIYCQPSLEIT